MKDKVLFGILLLAGLAISTCKKPQDEVFNGTARMRGVVLFNNYLTGTQDTAKNAVLTVTMAQGKATSAPYVETLTNGTFDIPSLASGTFTLSVVFDYKQPGSAKTDHYIGSLPITLATGEFHDMIEVAVSLVSIGAGTLQLKITDQSGAIVSGAQVCLYTDAAILAANRGTCSGSLASTVTNGAGKALFSGLQPGSYYVSVRDSAGKQLLDNSGTDQQALLVNNTAVLDSATVKISPVGGLLQLTVSDANNALLGGATVSLYTDTNLLVKYRGSSTGSIRSGTTNSQGVALFTGLPPATYYASAYLPAGSDTLSNKTSDTRFPLLPGTSSITNYPIILSPNAAAATTILKITITDNQSANISGASVCLYSDTTLLSKFRGTCAGSLMSATSDTNGSVSFSGLQGINYYISAYKVAGSDTLSNKATDTRTPVKPLLNKTTMVTVKIGQ